MNPKTPRRVVRQLTIQEKIQAVDRVHSGESKAAVARDIGVPESTLRGWCKGEEKLRFHAVASDKHSPSPPPAKIARLDTPLDFSVKELQNKTTPEPKVANQLYDSSTEEELKKEALIYWMRQASLPTLPLTGRAAESRGWFWKWYKDYGVLPQVPENKLSTNQSSDTDDDLPATASDAVYHGEKFLRWLECCSDPGITTVQILQFRYLLNNVKECAKGRTQVRDKNRRRK